MPTATSPGQVCWRYAARVLKPGGTFLFDTINRNPVSRFGTITVPENILQFLPKGTHDPEFFIKPRELILAMEKAGLVAGPTKGLGPRGISRRGDFVFGTVPTRSVIYMGSPASEGDTDA